MNCQTAKLVWNHPDGPIAGIRAHLPGVMERLEAVVAKYIRGDHDSFNEAVQTEAGNGNYFVTHADDADPLTELVHSVVGDAAANLVLHRYFTGIYGRPVFVANVCCSGCKIHDGTLSPEMILRIQQVAVNTEPEPVE